MAGTIVHVILSGIVSLVPQGGDQYLIRLQHTGEPHPHFPSLVVENGLVSTSIPKPDDEKPDRPAKPKYLAYKIAGNGELKIAGVPIDGVDTSGLHDVLKISDACQTTNRDCGVNKKVYDEVWVAVNGGFLHTAGLEPYRWRFSSESSVRRIAEEICWTFEIEEGPLVLTLPDGKTLAVDAPPGGDIEVRLQNVPEKDLIPTTPTGQPIGADTHVDLYFMQGTKKPTNVELLPEAPPMLFAVHPSHRLAGRRIVRSLMPSAPAAPSSTIASGSGPAAHKHSGGEELAERTARAAVDWWRTVRVNCPPALWDSLEVVSSP